VTDQDIYDKHQMTTVVGSPARLAIDFLGRGARREVVRVIGTNQVFQGGVGLFTDALTAGIRPVGLPEECWTVPTIPTQLVLDLVFDRPGRKRGLSWLSPDAALPDVLTVSRALARLEIPQRLRYQPAFVPSGRDSAAFRARVEKWFEKGIDAYARAEHSVSLMRHKIPARAAKWRDAIAPLDPASLVVAAVAPEDRQALNMDRRALAHEAHRQGRWTMMAFARDAEEAAWVEVLHALGRGIPVDACGFCSQYCFRVGPKPALCRNCRAVLHRVWRKRDLLWAYPRLARAMAAPMFWMRPHEVARKGKRLLDACVLFLRAHAAQNKGGRDHARSTRSW
jgi:hypothetical protein